MIPRPHPDDAPSSLSTIRSFRGGLFPPLFIIMTDVPDSIRKLQELTNSLNLRDEQLYRERDKLSFINTVIMEANNADDSKTLLQNIIHIIITKIGFEGGFIHLVSPDNNYLCLIAQENITKNAYNDLKKVEIKTCIFKGILTKEYNKVLEENVPLKHPKWYDKYGIRLLVIYPITYHNNIIGTITLFSKTEYILDSWFNDILTTISTHIGGTLHRIQVEQDLLEACSDSAVKSTELDAMNQSLMFHEKQLHEDLAILTSIINSIPSPMLWRLFNGTIVGCNNAFETLYGTSRQNIIGKNITELFPHTLSSSYLSMDKDVIHRGRLFKKGQISNIHGEFINASFNKATFSDSNNTEIGVVVFIYPEKL